MKKSLLFFFIILFTLSIYSQKSVKIRVAVLDFSAKGVEQNLADAVNENLITSLIDSGIYEVIERSQLNKVMKELKLQNSDDFNDELRTALGNLYGAKLVILGSVTKIGSNITINVRGVETGTGIAKFAKNLITNSEDNIPFLIPLLIDIISGKKIDESALNQSKNVSIDEKANVIKMENTEITAAFGRILIGEGRTGRDWNSFEFETAAIKNLKDRKFSKIIIEVNDDQVEFASVRIYSRMIKDLYIHDNFILGKGRDVLKVIDSLDKYGNKLEIEKVKINAKTINNITEARFKVYGIQ